VGTGRDRDPDKPAEPEESAPRRVGDIREEREGTGAEGRTDPEGHHLTDPDAATNRATTDAGRDTGRGELATELPSKYLPAVEYRDLPEPVPVTKIMGASVILLATAIGSGELLIWPYITTTVGVGLLWLASVGFAMQYFLNMEIERYTLVTGETAVTGFSRFWKPWGIVFALGAILPNAFPGWASSGATMITYLIGGGSVPLIATIALIAIGLAITVSPVIYQTLEKVEMVLVVIIVAFLLLAIVISTNAGVWAGVVTEAPSGVANLPRYINELGIATVLGAIAFAGAGGASNLVQSNWIRDKGLGMGARMPKIVSPITGEEEAEPSIGYMMPTDEENLRRWRGWWKVANQEQIFTFVILGLLTLIGLSVLVASVLPQGTYGEPGDIEFIQREAQALANQIGPWFEIFFYIAGFAVLFSTNIGIIDYVSRLTADTLKTGYLARSEFWTESKIYFVIAWIMCIGGSLILFAGLEQPLVLLIIASSGGGVVMFLYSGMLIWLNRRALPEPVKLKSWRLVAMLITFVMFAVLSLYLLYWYINAALTGQL
jgi:hypothetical protein